MQKKRSIIDRRQLLKSGMATATALISSAALSQLPRPRLRPVPTQYIAALGDPQAKSGDNAYEWGLWSLDPGPRGVYLEDYNKLLARDGVAPAHWTFDENDWWLEEHGLIMEAPVFPLPPGYYQVTGAREVTAILTVQPSSSDASQHWELDNNASIYDVTHLRCRSGRYTHKGDGSSCSPANARQSDFPVAPGAEMPQVVGCDKQDYAVLIVTAIAAL